MLQIMAHNILDLNYSNLIEQLAFDKNQEYKQFDWMPHNYLRNIQNWHQYKKIDRYLADRYLGKIVMPRMNLHLKHNNLHQRLNKQFNYLNQYLDYMYLGHKASVMETL